MITKMRDARYRMQDEHRSNSIRTFLKKRASCIFILIKEV